MNATTDWFSVTDLGGGWYRVSEAEGHFPCHSYVLEDGDEALVVDTGLGVDDLRGVVEDLVGTDVRVLLTHAHWDHIGAAHQFDDVLIDERERTPDGRVSIDGLTDESVERPAQFVAGWLEAGNEFPESFDPDSYEIRPVADVEVVTPGETLRIGERELELVATPGHSPGQLAVLDREAGICHGADVLEPGGTLYAHLEHSDVSAYRETVDRLIEYREAGAFDVLTLGHGEPIRGGDLAILEDVATALAAIERDDAPFETIETHWGPTRRYDIGGIEVLTRA
ncbi:MBL fold metallo-hydrolase [Natronobiforma cellulositropha]|uniref:MBL fold metallo-hydrolase n=1 Tax=Natronobiforma cellulositropha TaxID=1679076 RepID=UPI0021D5F1D2|nr:MBL fold metallo-hydrolase [Natronobiforma cellulositropha]